MADPEKPLEILRTIHSFDPCLACATHVFDMDGHEVTQRQGALRRQAMTKNYPSTPVKNRVREGTFARGGAARR